MRIVIAVALFCFGCGRSADPNTGEKDDQRFLRCAEPYDDGEEERISLPPLTVSRAGFNAQIHGIKRGLIVLGVISGIAEPTKANLRNVDFFLSQFKEAGAQAILVAGDVGRTESDMHRILERLSRAPVPILITPGAEENYDLYRRVMAELRKRHPQLVDMTLVRRMRIGHLNIVSLPGYHKPFYLQAKERGCGYGNPDLDATAALFDQEGVTVLLSPSPPRGTGRVAVDRARGDVNIGDPGLTETLASRKVKFGLFGHVYESGGHATLADGRSAVAPGIWQESLFLQAGSAEALPLATVGEGRSVGMAQLVSFSAARARYQTIHAPLTP